MILRLAQKEDLPAIVDIYNQAIPSKQSTGDTRPESHPGQVHVSATKRRTKAMRDPALLFAKN